MHVALGVRCAAALLACGLVALPAVAADAGHGGDASFERELWVTSGFLSRHTHHRSRYNEHNDGLGVEWRFAGQWQANAGHYRNSVRHGSTYLQLGWTPLQAQLPMDLRMRSGFSLGAVNGYPKVRRGGYWATFVPVVSLESERVGLNFVYIPSVGKRVDGAYALQLKLRVL
jgi:hypothetical protein